MIKDDSNYGYTEEELNEFSLETVRRIADKYSLSSNKKKKELISDILQHQSDLEYQDNDVVHEITNNEIVNNLQSNIAILPDDVIRYVADKLDILNIIKLCTVNKKFNTVVCKNDMFQKQLGLKYLTSHPERLPRDKSGNLEIIKELDKLSKQLKVTGGIMYGKEEYLGSSRGNKPGARKYLGPHGDEISVNREYLGLKGYEKYVSKIFTSLGSGGKQIVLKGALKGGHEDLVRYLINKGANIDQELYNAILKKHIDMVKNLIDNINIKQETINNLLSVASRTGDLEMVRYLLEGDEDTLNNINTYWKRADLHHSNDNALVVAADNGHLDIVKYLIGKGAKQHVIENVNNKDIIKYLRSLKSKK